MAATSLTLYLLLLAMGSIPAMQRWSARQLSAWLTQKVQAKVEIKNLRLGLLNRIVIDGICIHDQNDSLMLDIARIAAKIELLPLAHQAIRIENAQLFGAHARLYRETAGAKPNCQFLLDAFSSSDTTSTPIDLKLGKLLVRGMSVQYDVEDQAETPGKLNPNHLQGTPAQCHHPSPHPRQHQGGAGETGLRGEKRTAAGTDGHGGKPHDSGDEHPAAVDKDAPLHPIGAPATMHL